MYLTRLNNACDGEIKKEMLLDGDVIQHLEVKKWIKDHAAYCRHMIRFETEWQKTGPNSFEKLDREWMALFRSQS